MNLSKRVELFEKRLAIKAIVNAEGNLTLAAKLAGVSFRTMRYLKNKHNISIQKPKTKEKANVVYNYNGKEYEVSYNIEKNREIDIWLQNPAHDEDTLELFELPVIHQEAVEALVFKAASKKGI